MQLKDHLSWVGTLLSALAVGACCAGPLAFVLFGTSVGALGTFSALEPYRAWFFVAALGFWGWGYYRLYLSAPREATAEVCDEDCRRQSRTARALLWFSLAFLVAAWVYPAVVVWWMS